jgi:outer membrane protein assembly factor BamB
MRPVFFIGAVIGCSSLHAQGFNVVNLPANNGSSRGVSVREVPAGYLVFGDKFDVDLQYRAHVELHGPDGELIWERALVDSGPSAFGYSDPVSPTWGPMEWLASVAVSTQEGRRWRAYRFNDTGDTLWTRSLASGSWLYPRAAVRQGGAYYFSGLYAANPTDTVKAMVARLDGFGSIIQMVDFPQIQYDVLSLSAGLGGDLLMAGGRSGSLFPNRSVVMRLDTALNVIWSRELLTGLNGFSGYSSTVAKVVSDAEGNVLLGGTCHDAYVINSTSLAEFYIVKLSRLNGSVMWSRRYPVSMSEFGMLLDLEVLPDGDLVSCGFVTPPEEVGFRGGIYRYTPDGEERWRRYYRFLTNPNALNELMDVQPASDGGFVLTGSTRLSPQFATVLWLLRLDEHGCLEPGCQSVGVNELVVGLPEGAFQCGPVPTTDELTVRLDLPDALGPFAAMRLVVTDMMGRQVLEARLDDRQEQHALLRLGELGAGTYIIHLADGMRLFASRKIMVQ